MSTAHAHPNIALIKYWGKQPLPGNLPATPSLSITLSQLTTTTTVSEHERDEIRLNGDLVVDQKITDFLAALRQSFAIPPMRIESSNNFPTGAGLASSASGFAALICAINDFAGLNLDVQTMSDWARRGSASAARSLYGGYVALLPPLWTAQPIASAESWPLQTIVAVTSVAAKAVSSTQGMERSRQTSAFYSAWTEHGGDDYATAAEAIERRDFTQLADIAELNCLKMHSVMLTSQPPLMYWNPATVACIEVIRTLRDRGTEVFFTVDAGPQVKAICSPEAATEVSEALTSVPGVVRTIACGMGPGAHLAASSPGSGSGKK